MMIAKNSSLFSEMLAFVSLLSLLALGALEASLPPAFNAF